MNPLFVPVVAVSAIYYIWRVYAYWVKVREEAIRQRVVYMLWVAAQRVK